MTTADLIKWISEFGAILLFLVAFASCLALPVPASIVFMASGSIASSGDADFTTFLLAGIAGATIGDQLGYFIGKYWLRGSFRSRWKKSLQKAEHFNVKWGRWSIFLTRWLFSPLGPWINFSSGITGHIWYQFTLAAIAGEIVWVSIYMGLGYAFSEQAQAIADIATNTVWLLLALGAAVMLGKKLFANGKAN